MIDKEGLRANVGIILSNTKGQVFWGKRVGVRNAWQFPQGGINDDEAPEQAMFRELHEELGLEQQDVEILAITDNWITYYLPKYLRRYKSTPLCIGQKQKWFLLKLLSDDDKIDFYHTIKPEFSSYHWVDYWLPTKEVIAFKREVYKSALRELEPYLLNSLIVEK